MKIVIGVTGNISSGKSEFCKILEKKGAIWIEADKIGHKIIEENKEKIKKIFGSYLERREIAEIIFKDIKIKSEYERWIHGKIKKEVKKIIENGKDGYYLVEGALIYEAKADRIMDYVVYLKASENILLERAKNKGYDLDLFKKIIYFQNIFKDKEKLADFVVENESDKKTLEIKAKEIYDQIKNRKPKFICDSTCLREAKWLRLIGFDTVSSNNLRNIIKGIYEEKRFLITRKKKINLFPSWKIFKVPEGEFKIRIKRIIDFFDLKEKIDVFSRCPLCNSHIEEIDKAKIKGKVPYYTYKTQENFYICKKCDKIYWMGSHYFFFENHLKKIIK
ncbi:MAG: dephospho-CoA kinase [Candidatus Hydrothermales bacterium]